MTASKERKIFFLKIFENQNIFGCRLRRDNNQPNVNLTNVKKSEAPKGGTGLTCLQC
jgi:hypothetical protein